MHARITCLLVASQACGDNSKSYLHNSAMSFSTNLKAARKAAKVTQQAIADEFKISRQAIVQWENGITMPDAARIPRLAELVNSTPDKLFEGSAPINALHKSRSETLLERAFDLMTELEALDQPEREKFDSMISKHQKLIDILKSKGER